jgi:hypothetical protein
VLAVAGVKTAHIEAGRAIIACLVPQLLHKRDMPFLLTSAFVAWWGRLPGLVSRRLLPHLLKHLGVPKEVTMINTDRSNYTFADQGLGDFPKRYGSQTHPEQPPAVWTCKVCLVGGPNCIVGDVHIVYKYLLTQRTERVLVPAAVWGLWVQVPLHQSKLSVWLLVGFLPGHKPVAFWPYFPPASIFGSTIASQNLHTRAPTLSLTGGTNSDGYGTNSTGMYR